MKRDRMFVWFSLIKSQKDLNTFDKQHEHKHVLEFLTPNCSKATVYWPLSSFLYIRTVHSYCKAVYCAKCCTNTVLLVRVCQHFNQMSHYAKNADNTDYQPCLCITHLPGCSLLSQAMLLECLQDLNKKRNQFL